MSSFKLKLELYILDIINGHRKGKFFLSLLSYLYYLIIKIRNWCYDKKLFLIYHPNLPIISVGNITAGGTGKTPFVCYLAKQLSPFMKVAILLRGYRIKQPKTRQSFQLKSDMPVQHCGDEAFWLLQKLPDSQIWVGVNRFQSVERAKSAGAELVILDDGMQHRKLHRNFEVVLINGQDPLGKSYFLPRGLLRDCPKRLKKADLIVVTDPFSIQELELSLARYTSSPLIFIETVPKICLKGKKVGVFCAIGSPQRFVTLVQKAGGEVISTFFKPDHTSFEEEELSYFALKACPDILACTEKDFVKLSISMNCKVPIIPVATEIQIIKGQDIWDKFFNKIKESLFDEQRI